MVKESQTSATVGIEPRQPLLWYEDRVDPVAVVIVLTLLSLGALAHEFKRPEPFNLKRFLSEGILMLIGGVGILASSILQDVSWEWAILVACLASLGGVRFLDHLVRAFLSVLVKRV